MSERDCYLQVAYALSGCQLVEQEIELYLTEALELATKCIGDRMTFKFSGHDYDNASLQRLIAAFKKLSGNAKLALDLEQFKEERNFLSHQGISYCLDRDHELSMPEVLEMQPRLKMIQNEAERLRRAIHEEANNFRGHLWFEDLSRNG